MPFRTDEVPPPDAGRAERWTGKVLGTRTARAAGETGVPATGVRVHRATVVARIRVASARPNSSPMHLVAPAPKGR